MAQRRAATPGPGGYRTGWTPNTWEEWRCGLCATPNRPSRPVCRNQGCEGRPQKGWNTQPGGKGAPGRKGYADIPGDHRPQYGESNDGATADPPGKDVTEEEKLLKKQLDELDSAIRAMGENHSNDDVVKNLESARKEVHTRLTILNRYMAGEGQRYRGTRR